MYSSLTFKCFKEPIPQRQIRFLKVIRNFIFFFTAIGTKNIVFDQKAVSPIKDRVSETQLPAKN